MQGSGIYSKSWKVAYKGIVPDSILDNMTAEKSEKKFLSCPAEELNRNVMAILRGKAVGFMCLGKCRDEDLDDSYGEIWGVYLLPDVWRKGIGTKLINWGVSHLKERGCGKITLWVLEDNINARRFYEKMGFAHDGTVKEINIGKPLHEFRYLKGL